MQKIMTVRASQRALDEELAKFTAAGYTIKSVSRGSEWSRVGFSFNWTVVLEYDENVVNTENIEKIKGDIQARSAGKNVGLIIGLLGIALVVILVVILVVAK